MAKKDYYETLGINKSATSSEIKSAYRKLAKKYHPDMNPNDKRAEQLFKEVTEAYNVLSDEEKRKLYDQFGMAAFDGSMGENPYEYARESGEPYTNFSDFFRNAGSSNRGYHEFHYSTGNMNDIFGDMFDEFFDRKQDVYTTAEIPYTTAALGGEAVFQTHTGKVSCKIPPGTQSGTKIRLKGKGMFGGDQYVTIQIAVPKYLSPEEKTATENLRKAQRYRNVS